MSRATVILFATMIVGLTGVSVMAQSQQASSKIPAIDQAAPKEFETATLALG